MTDATLFYLEYLLSHFYRKIHKGGWLFNVVHFIQVYLCEKLSLVNEMYFAITLDRTSAGPVSFPFQYVIFDLLYIPI